MNVLDTHRSAWMKSHLPWGRRESIALSSSILNRSGAMSTLRKAMTAGAIATIVVTSVFASTPASAWGRGWGGGGGGGWGRGGGWGGGGWGHAVWGGGGWGRGGWGGGGYWAGAALTGLAVGAAAASYPYGYGYGYGNYYGGCVARQPAYDAWGNFIGYQRVYVPCY
jgi:hypothetical protein